MVPPLEASFRSTPIRPACNRTLLLQWIALATLLSPGKAKVRMEAAMVSTPSVTRSVRPGTRSRLTAHRPVVLVNVTFTDATDFSVMLNGGTATSYSTSTYGQMVYNAPTSGFSQLIFSDRFHSYAASQSFASTLMTNSSFNFTASGVANLYIYSNGASTATVDVGIGSGSNFYVDDAGTSTPFSYIADPIKGIYSELSGFVSEAASGSGNKTYAYVYSRTGGNFVRRSKWQYLHGGRENDNARSLSQMYMVAASNACDLATLHTQGGSFVGTPSFSYISGTFNSQSFLIGICLLPMSRPRQRMPPTQLSSTVIPGTRLTGRSPAAAGCQEPPSASPAFRPSAQKPTAFNP